MPIRDKAGLYIALLFPIFLTLIGCIGFVAGKYHLFTF
jgi:hypothetical protein